jgi:thiol-disulfide isomerase/thioredoxin
MTTFKKFIIPVVLIVGVAAGALFLIKSQLGRPGGSSEAASDHGPARVGSIIPDFSLSSAQGKPAKFSDVKAKVILVNFWATWCEACMVEMPSIVQLRNAYKDKGFEVVGINLDENQDAVLPKVEKELGIGFPVFGDTEGKITDFFDVHAIPLSVIVGAGRKILFIENGERNWNDQEIHQQLEQWLSE